MKILLFANTDWYLYNFRLSLARALRDRGHDVVLLSPRGAYGTKLRDLGFRWIVAPMDRRSLDPVSEFAFVLWLRRLLVREQPQLVHGFTIKCAIYGSLAARLMNLSGATAPCRVISVAGMGYVFTNEDLRARILRPMVRVLFRLALGGPDARLILQNTDDRALFVHSHLIDPDHVCLVRGSGVDCGRFAPATDREHARSPALRVLLPARLLWDKGIAEYIEASRLLHAQGRRVDFLLAGDPDPGNPAAVPESEVRSWVRQGLVQWLGHVEDMPALLRNVDAVVIPSYREGLPKGLIEAAACALPLVTTDAPGCREVVADGVNGLLVPVRDARAIAAAIARLHDNPGLRHRLGQAARTRALEEFDERIVIRKTLEVYEELLQAHSWASRHAWP